MTQVAILISYRIGDPELLNICLNAVERHTKVDYEVVLAVDGKPDNFDAWNETKNRSRLQYSFFDGGDLFGSARHGEMLDVVTKRIQSLNDHKYILTLDSDCIPIADNWLDDMMTMHGHVSGILHPWIPPSKDLDETTIEWRLRSRWNWRNTHVACQVTPVWFTKAYKISYRDGDDTGLMIPMKAHEMGKTVRGFMPTMCPFPDDDFDPEFNRDVCVVFSDRVCHIGGGSRDAESVIWPAASFQKARQRIRDEGHARWILEEGYKYKFDREAEVVEAKMQVMYSLMKNYLAQGNTRLFK